MHAIDRFVYRHFSAKQCICINTCSICHVKIPSASMNLIHTIYFQLKVTLLVVNDYTVMCFFQVVRITITKLTVNVYILKPLILKFLRKYRLKVSINVIIDIYNTNFLNFLCFTDICQSLSSAVQRNSTFMENISLE